MQTRRPTDTHVTVIPDASHDVHLDRPDALYEVGRAGPAYPPGVTSPVS